MALGERNGIVAVSALHRSEAFAGARAVVDGPDRLRVEGTLLQAQ